MSKLSIRMKLLIVFMVLFTVAFAGAFENDNFLLFCRHNYPF